ncbi:MAG: Undecaprenyl-phosphate galactose phosphotransferase [Proteobacteria bacterium]|nr:Undecaprenyl-phosphate galactose phosphotransferase [Pseudomonadota bacterium]
MKRVFDVVLATFGLLVLAVPLYLLVRKVRWELGSPVFFTQVRPGMRGKPFKMVKFRSMTSECCPDGELLADAVRLTPFGRWLRSTSLDELPELWNVLKGDMSLVGPRPLAMAYLPLYSPSQMRRHEVRPGITGWAQINGRNAISWSKKFELDVWYVDNRSLWLDTKILFMTVKKVFLKSDVKAEGQDEVESFNGTN